MRKAGMDMTELKDANRQAAEIAAGAGKSIVPHREGWLAASIRAAGTLSAGIVRAGNNRKSGSGVPYAGPIHWGWPDRKIEANPFLTDAAQSTETKWVPLYEEHVNKIISSMEVMT